MAVQQLSGVVTVRLHRDGFDPATGRAKYSRQIIRFAEFAPGDIVNVPSDQGDADDVVSYIARKLGVSEDSLEISEWRHYWQVRFRYGETI